MAQTTTTSNPLTEAQLRVLHELSQPNMELRYMRGGGFGGSITKLYVRRNDVPEFVRDVHASVISALRNKGLIEAVDRPDSKKHKYYVLTPAGAEFVTVPED